MAYASAFGAKNLQQHSQSPSDKSDQRLPAGVSDRASDAAASPIDIFGRIEHVRSYTPASGGGIVVVADEVQGTLTLRGTFAFRPAPGKHLSARAQAEVHPRFGIQYKAGVVAQDVDSKDKQSVVAFLSEDVGAVDAALAARLFDSFGRSLLELIRDAQPQLLTVEGMTVERLQHLRTGCEQQRVARAVWGYLAKNGISDQAASAIYRKFGSAAAEVAAKRPYDLAVVQGLDFKALDRIAGGSGEHRHERARLSAAVLATIDAAERDAHTCLPLPILIKRVQHMLAPRVPDSVTVSAAVDSLAAAGQVRRVPGVDVDLIARPATLEVEARLTKAIIRLVKGCRPGDERVEIARKVGQRLGDEDQAAAVEGVVRYPVTVITGGPGCGKTTTTRSAAEALLARERDPSALVMSAPTNMAARRIAEATGHDAGTLHSRLECEFQPGGGYSFRRNGENSLPGRYHFIDEATLADTRIACAYLEAIPTGAQLVLVGDVDQLKSVGAGDVFTDIIESGVVPVFRLTRPHRASLLSGITVTAHKVNRGDFGGIDLSADGDFRFVSASGAKHVRHAVISQYRELIAEFGHASVQVLAAQYETEVGINALNEALRGVANPPGPGKPELRLGSKIIRQGDRVMRAFTDANAAKNEVGMVTAVAADRASLQVTFGDRVVSHTLDEAKGLELAYVKACHRAQGTEDPAVLLVAPAEHRRMWNRNMLYTSMTRGKSRVVMVSDPATFRHAVETVAPPRFTLLRTLLRRSLPQLKTEKRQIRVDGSSSTGGRLAPLHNANEGPAAQSAAAPDQAARGDQAEREEARKADRSPTAVADSPGRSYSRESRVLNWMRWLPDGEYSSQLSPPRPDGLQDRQPRLNRGEASERSAVQTRSHP